MQKRQIIRLSPNNVSEFCNAARHCSFDINIANVKREKKIIDAKSLVSVLGLDLSSNLIVTYHGENLAFEGYIADLQE